MTDNQKMLLHICQYKKMFVILRTTKKEMENKGYTLEQEQIARFAKAMGHPARIAILFFVPLLPQAVNPLQIIKAKINLFIRICFYWLSFVFVFRKTTNNYSKKIAAIRNNFPFCIHIARKIEKKA